MTNIFNKIKQLKIQGANEIAIASLEHLKKYASHHGFDSGFHKEAMKLHNARPTAVALYNVLNMIEEDKNLQTIDALIKSLKSCKIQIAKQGKKYLNKNKIVITHCHSSSAIEVIKSIKPKLVIVTETEPKLQGIRTAKELSGYVNTLFVIDSASGYYMPKTDYFIVGADAIRKEGVVNKIGTCPMAITAKAYGKKVYVAASLFKIDKRPKIEIEMRPKKEVHSKYIKNVEIENPAFDITPWKYIDRVIMEDGARTPEYFRKYFRKK